MLLLIKVPPPLTGATLMNQRVYESEVLRANFNIRSIPISYVNNLNEMGKFRINKLFTVISVYFKLAYQLIFIRPKLVYFQISPLGFGFLRDFIYVFLIKLFRVKIVFHLHGKGINTAAKNKFYKFLYKWAFKKNEIICLSSKLTYDIEEVFDGKPFVVPNGIPNKNTSLEKNITNGDVTLLFLSNLLISKGILDYLDALAILKEKGFYFKGIIVGMPGDLTENELLKLIKRKNLNDFVKYLGGKYGNEKLMILQKSNILIYPTSNDAFPLVNIEALQHGIPIIATSEGAIPEIVDDGITGFVVEKKSPQQIAVKTELLINNPGLRKKMGEAGKKKYLEQYTLDKFENNLKKVFEEILSRENNVNK